MVLEFSLTGKGRCVAWLMNETKKRSEIPWLENLFSARTKCCRSDVIDTSLSILAHLFGSETGVEKSNYPRTESKRAKHVCISMGSSTV